MRNEDGIFHFKLCYPEATEYDFPCNEWKQRSNPLEESTVEDFEGINLTWPLRSDGEPFGGLMNSTNNKNLMDDDPSKQFYWNSVGTISGHGGYLPGPVGKGWVKKKEMFVHN